MIREATLRELSKLTIVPENKKCLFMSEIGGKVVDYIEDSIYHKHDYEEYFHD